MSKKDIGSDLAWIDADQIRQDDYDELPEVTEEQFASASVHQDGKPARGRPPHGSSPKKQVTLRLDPSVEARFRSSGPGWQGRMNSFLASNETMLKMIVEFDVFIRDMEAMLGDLHAGRIRTTFEPPEASIVKVEQNIRNVKETVRNLREELVWEPIVGAE